MILYWNIVWVLEKMFCRRVVATILAILPSPATPMAHICIYILYICCRVVATILAILPSPGTPMSQNKKIQRILQQKRYRRIKNISWKMIKGLLLFSFTYWSSIKAKQAVILKHLNMTTPNFTRFFALQMNNNIKKHEQDLAESFSKFPARFWHISADFRQTYPITNPRISWNISFCISSG